MKFLKKQIEKTLKVLKQLIYIQVMPITRIEYVSCGYKVTSNPPEDGWRAFDINSTVSGKDGHFWFHLQFETPKSVNQFQRVELGLKTPNGWEAVNPQSIVYIDGIAKQAFDINHTSVLLDFNRNYDIYIYFYVGMLDDAVHFEPKLQVYDTRIEKLWYDMSVPFETALIFDTNKDEYIKPIKELDIAIGYLDFREVYSDAFYNGIELCEKYLEDNYYKKLCGKSDYAVSLIGHTHIDVAWMWTLSQTKEKAQRSFSTVLNLMLQYPEYKFMSSQMQLYQYVKEADGELYGRIKEAVKNGSWEVEGAMWLEADCNLSSGESLVRQIIYGKKFMIDEFGVDSKVLWLPDVFGYSAALPQILKSCGVNKFVTSKISWNDTNPMPHDTFLWEGIDGTKIFTHFLTSCEVSNEHEKVCNQVDYNGQITPSYIYGTYKRNSDRQYINDAVLTFGFGDGGGGPTKDMLEQQKRFKLGLCGMPKTKPEFVGKYLDRIEKEFNSNCKKLKEIPLWVGELYLEYHRGTYTTMAANKKYNRKSELLLQTTEALSEICTQKLHTEYPAQELHDSWQTVLLNQFHDIIPGSSIKEVYDESHLQYETILNKTNEIKTNMLSLIAANVDTNGGLLVYNPCSFTVTDTVLYEGKYITVHDIPAFGWSVVNPDDFYAKKIDVSTNKIENNYVRVRFDKNGNIRSIFDKTAKRELVQKNCIANELQIFEDMPYAYDAWEISPYHKNKMWIIDGVESVEKVDFGSKAGLRIKKIYHNSVIVQYILLNDYNSRIDFKTNIDWHEDHVLLKSAFPFNLHCTIATYDIQFGNAARTNNANTSWDEAKFEVCAHKWADLSEDDYGVSLLNDCKYGYSAKGGTLKLSLLKAPTNPNPDADRGMHDFVYSIYPHAFSIANSDVIQEAYKLNIPLESVKVSSQDGVLSENYSFISCDNNDIIIETVKKAEDDGSVILRMYQTRNKKSTANISLGFEVDKAFLCDMLENEKKEINVKNNGFKISVTPYEIVTVKLI